VSRLGIALAIFFAGCVAVGIVPSSDPAVKLAQATELFDRRPRPVLAESLIQEALDSSGRSTTSSVRRRCSRLRAGTTSSPTSG